MNHTKQLGFLLTYWLKVTGQSCFLILTVFWLIVTPEFVSTWSQSLELVTGTSGLAQAVATEGNFVCLGAGAQLSVLDIDDPVQPIWKGALSLPDTIRKIVTQKSGPKTYAYLTLGPAGFRVVDLSQPDKPISLSSLAQFGVLEDIFFEEGQAYVADLQGGWHIIDVKDPVEPILQSSSLSSLAVTGLHVHRKKAYIVTQSNGAVNNSGLYIYDLSLKTNPERLQVDLNDTLTPDTVLDGSARRIVVRKFENQTLAFITLGANGVQVLDVTDPTQITEVDRIGIPDAWDLELGDKDNKLYISNQYLGLYIFEDATNTGTALNQAWVDFIPGPTFAFTVSSTSKQLSLYTVDGLTQLTILERDLKLPISWKVVGNGRTLGTVEDVTIFSLAGQQIIATANGLNGVALFNIDSSIIKAGDLKESKDKITYLDNNTPVSRLQFVPETGLLYIFDDGLTIVDPAQNSKVLSQISFSSRPRGLAYVPSTTPTGIQSFTYIAGDGIEVYDLSNSSSPQLIKSIPIQNVEDLFLFRIDNRPMLCLACGKDGIRILDVTDPYQPTTVTVLPTVAGGFSRRVIVEGQLGFIADGYSGMRIIDLADPEQPMEIARLKTSSSVQDLVIDGEIVFIADANHGIQMVNISDLGHPQIIDNYDTAGSVLALTQPISSSQILVADAGNGLQVLSVNLPLNVRSPVLTSITPREVLAQEQVTIQGHHFDTEATVEFGQVTANSDSIEWISASEIRVAVPTGVVEGWVDLTITNSDQLKAIFPSRVKIVGKQARISIVSPTNPDLELEKIEFNTIPLGADRPPIVPIQIKNKGAAKLKIHSIDFPSRKFSSQPVPPFIVDIEETESVTISFQPTSILKLEDQITINWTTDGQDTLEVRVLPVSLTVTGKTESFTVLGIGRHITDIGGEIVETAYVERNHTIQIQKTGYSPIVSPVRSITSGSAYTYIASIDPNPETGYAPIEIGDTIEVAVNYRDPTIPPTPDTVAEDSVLIPVLKYSVDGGEDVDGDIKASVSVKESHLARREIRVDFKIPFPKPKITDISRIDPNNPNLNDPSGGGGTPIRLHGINFRPGLTVKIQTGDVKTLLTPATQVELISGTEMQVITPIGMPGADRSVVVVNIDGQESDIASSQTYTYNQVERIAMLNPDAPIQTLLDTPVLAESTPLAVPIDTSRELKAIGFEKNGDRIELQDPVWEIIGNSRYGGITTSGGLTTGKEKGDFKVRVTYGPKLSVTQPVTVTAGIPAKIEFLVADPEKLTTSTKEQPTSTKIKVRVIDKLGNPVIDLRPAGEDRDTTSLEKTLQFSAKYTEDLVGDNPNRPVGEFVNFVSNGDGTYQITYITPSDLKVSRGVSIVAKAFNYQLQAVKLSLYLPAKVLVIRPKQTVILDLSTVENLEIPNIIDFRQRVQAAKHLPDLNKILKGEGLATKHPLLVVTEDRAGNFLEAVPVNRSADGERYEVAEPEIEQLEATSLLLPAPIRPGPESSSVEFPVFITGFPVYKDPERDVERDLVPAVIQERLSRLEANGQASKKFIIQGVDDKGNFVTHKKLILSNGYTYLQIGQEDLQISTTVGQLVDGQQADNGYQFTYLASTTQQRKVRLEGRAINVAGSLDLLLVSGETTTIDFRFPTSPESSPQLPADGQSKIAFNLRMMDRYGNPVILGNNPISSSPQIEFVLKVGSGATSTANGTEEKFFLPADLDIDADRLTSLGRIQNFVDLKNGSYTAEYVSGTKIGPITLQVKSGNAVTETQINILLGESARIELLNLQTPDQVRGKLSAPQDPSSPANPSSATFFPAGNLPIADGNPIDLFLAVTDAQGNSVGQLTLAVNADRGQAGETVREIPVQEIAPNWSDEAKTSKIKSLYQVEYDPPISTDPVKITVRANHSSSSVVRDFDLPVLPNQPSSAESTITLGDQGHVPPADGIESVTAIVTIRDKNQNLIPDQAVRLVVEQKPPAAIPVVTPDSETTGANGTATFRLKLKYAEIQKDDVLKVQAELTTDDTAFQPPTALVAFSSPQIAQIEFIQLPVGIRGNGEAEGEIFFLARNEVGKSITGAEISLYLDDGEIVKPPTPTGDGSYRAIYRAPDRSGMVTLTAQADSEVHQSKTSPQMINNQFKVLAGDVSPTMSSVTISPTTILANADEVTRITVKLMDKWGNLIADQPVELSVPDYPQEVVIIQPGRTDGNGTAIGTIRSARVFRLGQDLPIEVEVKAKAISNVEDTASNESVSGTEGSSVASGGNEIPLISKGNRLIVFSLVPPTPRSIVLDFKDADGNPIESLPADGISQATLEINVLDVVGNPVAPLEPDLILTASAGQIGQAENPGDGNYRAAFTVPDRPTRPGQPGVVIEARVAVVDSATNWLKGIFQLPIDQIDFEPPTFGAETVNSKEIRLNFNEPVVVDGVYSELMAENWRVDENPVDRITPIRTGILESNAPANRFQVILVTPIVPDATPLVSYQLMKPLPEINPGSNNTDVDRVAPSFETKVLNTDEIELIFSQPVDMLTGAVLTAENWAIDGQVASGVQLGAEGLTLRLSLSESLVPVATPNEEPLLLGEYQPTVEYQPSLTKEEAKGTSVVPDSPLETVGAVQDLSGNLLPTMSVKAADKIPPGFQVQITGSNQVLLTFIEPVQHFDPREGNGWVIRIGPFEDRLAEFIKDFEPIPPEVNITDLVSDAAYRRWIINFKPEYDESRPWFLPFSPGREPDRVTFQYQAKRKSADSLKPSDRGGNPPTPEEIEATFKELPDIILLDKKGNQLETGKPVTVSEGQTMDLDLIVTNDRLPGEASVEDGVSSVEETPFSITTPQDSKIVNGKSFTDLESYKDTLSDQAKIDWVNGFTASLLRQEKKEGVEKNFLAQAYTVEFGYNIASANIPQKTYPFIVSVEDRSFPNQPATKSIQFEVDNQSQAEQVKISIANDRLVSDGIQQTQIIVNVTDSEGNPVNDEKVILTTADGRIFPTGRLDEEGNYSGTYTTDKDRIGDVIITAKTSKEEVSAQTQIFQLPEEPKTVHLSIPNPEVPADGKSTTNLIVTVRDAKNRPIDEVEIEFEPPKYGQIFKYQADGSSANHAGRTGEGENSTKIENSKGEDSEIENSDLQSAATPLGRLTGKHLAIYQAPAEFLPEREAVKIVAKVVPVTGGPPLIGAASLTLYQPNRIPTLVIKDDIGEISGDTLRAPVYENTNLKLELVVTDEDQDPITLYAENLPPGAVLNPNGQLEWNLGSQIVKANESEKSFDVIFHATDGRGGSVSRQLKVTVKHQSAAKQIRLFANPNRLVVSANGRSLSTVLAILIDENGIRQPNEALRITARFTPDLPTEPGDTLIPSVGVSSPSLETKTNGDEVAVDLEVVEEGAGIYKATFEAGNRSGQVTVQAEIDGTTNKSKPISIEILPDKLKSLVIKGQDPENPKPISLRAGQAKLFTVFGQDQYQNPSTQTGLPVQAPINSSSTKEASTPDSQLVPTKSIFQWEVSGGIGEVTPGQSSDQSGGEHYRFVAQRVGEGDIGWFVLINGEKIERKTGKITVTSGQIDKVLVTIVESPEQMQLVPIGETRTLEVTAEDAFNNPVFLDKEQVSQWTVSNDIGVLDTDSSLTSQPLAIFTPRRIGSGRVSVTIGELKGVSKLISVVTGPLQSIQIQAVDPARQKQDPIELTTGDQIKFAIRGYDEAGTQLPVPKAATEWQIVGQADDNTSTQIIGQGNYDSGIYTFEATTVGQGYVKLIFMPPGDASSLEEASPGGVIETQSAKMAVSAGPVHALRIDPKNTTAIAGETIKFTIIPQDAYDNPVSLEKPETSKSTADAAESQARPKQKAEIRLQLVTPTGEQDLQPIGKILEDYQLKVEKTGIGQVKATLIQPELEELPSHKQPPRIETYAQITVEAGPIIKIEVRPKSEQAVEVGKSIRFRAVGFDELENPIQLNTGLVWKLDGQIGDMDTAVVGKLDVKRSGQAKVEVTYTPPDTDEQFEAVSGEIYSGPAIAIHFTKTQRPKTVGGAGKGMQLVLPVSAANVPLPFVLLSGALTLDYPADLLQFEKTKVVGGYTVKTTLVRPGVLTITFELKLSPATRQPGAPVHFSDLIFTALPEAVIGAKAPIEVSSLQLEGSKGLIPSTAPKLDFHILPDVIVEIVEMLQATSPVGAIEGTPAPNAEVNDLIASTKPNETMTFDLGVKLPDLVQLKLTKGQINFKQTPEIASFELLIPTLPSTDPVPTEVEAPALEPEAKPEKEIEEPVEGPPPIRLKPISKGQAVAIDNWQAAFGEVTKFTTVAQLKVTISAGAPAKTFSLPITATFETSEKDFFGISIPKSQLLVLDNRPPEGKILVDGGKTHTNKLEVELTLDIKDLDGEVTRMWIQNTDDFTDPNQDPDTVDAQPKTDEAKERTDEQDEVSITWEPFSRTKDWKLSGGEGIKKIYGQFEDRLGNVTDPALVGTITYDVTKPTAAIKLIDKNLKNPTVKVEMLPTDKLSNMLTQGEVRLSNTEFKADSKDEELKWVPVQKTIQWELSAGSGMKTVYAQFRDPSGNLSGLISAEMEVDTTPPEIFQVTPADGQEYVPINAPVIITFDENIDSQGLTTADFEVVSDLESQPQTQPTPNLTEESGDDQHQIIYQGYLTSEGATIRFVPKTIFGNLARISVFFEATVVDKYENPTVHEKSWSFSTGVGVWPGDTNDDGIVDVLDIIPLGRYWQQKTISRQAQSAVWLAHPAQPAAPIEATFADANGDGFVSADDIVPIAQNWNQTHVVPKSTEKDKSSSLAPVSPDPLQHQGSDRRQFSKQLEIYQQLLSRLARMNTLPSDSQENEEVPASALPGAVQLRLFLQGQIQWLKQQLIPKETNLLPNYPNPFNPETWIPFQLATAGTVVLTIYDSHGREVRRIDLGHQSSGFYLSKSHAIHWDGTNQTGESVASGIYFYQLYVSSPGDLTVTATEFSRSQKLVLLK